MEKVQAVVDNILVTLNDFTYTSGASTIAEVTFQNLTGTSSLTVEQAGGYHVSASITDNSDLTTITVTGASIGNVTVTDNGDLAELTLDHTSKVDDDDDTSIPRSSYSKYF
jgi:hypothetical protein